MSRMKPEAGKPIAELTFPKLGGGMLSIGGKREHWTLFIVYRGKHCGRCKKYLGILQTMLAQWHEAGFEIITVSADPEHKAQADVEEFGWTFDVGYDLSEEQMHQLGVYISDPLTPEETDRRFAEPAVFCIRPDGSIQIAAISNGPAARPDLAELLDGMAFTIKHDKPARGQVV